MVEVGNFLTSPGKPADRSANKTVYMIVASDETVKEKMQYYKAVYIVEGAATIEFKGWLLTKAQADQLTKNAGNSVGIEVSRKIPWHKVERIDIYKKRNKENENE